MVVDFIVFIYLKMNMNLIKEENTLVNNAPIQKPLYLHYNLLCEEVECSLQCDTIYR